MEALENKLNELKGVRNDNSNEIEEERKKPQKLTRNELINKRRELLHLRIQQSQKSAKARWRNKIKSKKVHKLLKRKNWRSN